MPETNERTTYKSSWISDNHQKNNCIIMIIAKTFVSPYRVIPSNVQSCRFVSQGNLRPWLRIWESQVITMKPRATDHSIKDCYSHTGEPDRSSEHNFGPVPLWLWKHVKNKVGPKYRYVQYVQHLTSNWGGYFFLRNPTNVWNLKIRWRVHENCLPCLDLEIIFHQSNYAAPKPNTLRCELEMAVT